MGPVGPGTGRLLAEIDVPAAELVVGVEPRSVTAMSVPIRFPAARPRGLGDFTPARRATSVQDASVHEARGRCLEERCFGLSELRSFTTTAAGAPIPTARAAVDAMTRELMRDRSSTSTMR
jgi:hypothetical protein